MNDYTGELSSHFDLNKILENPAKSEKLYLLLGFAYLTINVKSKEELLQKRRRLKFLMFHIIHHFRIKSTSMIIFGDNFLDALPCSGVMKSTKDLEM